MKPDLLRENQLGAAGLAEMLGDAQSRAAPEIARLYAAARVTAQLLATKLADLVEKEEPRG